LLSGIGGSLLAVATGLYASDGRDDVSVGPSPYLVAAAGRAIQQPSRLLARTTKGYRSASFEHLTIPLPFFFAKKDAGIRWRREV
jgi:hypothetical protein